MKKALKAGETVIVEVNSAQVSGRKALRRHSGTLHRVAHLPHSPRRASEQIAAEVRGVWPHDGPGLTRESLRHEITPGDFTFTLALRSVCRTDVGASGGHM